MPIQRPTDEELGAHRTIQVTTVGRRTGQPRRMEIWWFYVGGRFFITGPPGARDWYANVNGDPNVTIHVAGWDLAATALPVSDLDTRSMVFDSKLTRWYSSTAQRQRLIDDGPMIEIRFRIGPGTAGLRWCACDWTACGVRLRPMASVMGRGSTIRRLGFDTR